MLFFVAISVVGAALAAYQFGFLNRRRKRSVERNWEDIVATLEEVNLRGIRDIADMFLNPTRDQLRLEPPTMWKMLGGLNGLQQMSRNADAMLELCIYAERWDFQGPVISEMIRLDAVNLNKAVRRLELSMVYGFGKIRSHFAVMEAAAHYDLIRRRLLGQYEKTHMGRLPILRQRLGI